MVVPLWDYAFIEFLWRYWAPGSLWAAIGYYRALMRPSLRDPALQEMRERMARPIATCTLALCGGNDVCRFPMRGQAEFFTGEYENREIPQSGLFLHREQPEAVNRELLRWLDAV